MGVAVVRSVVRVEEAVNLRALVWAHWPCAASNWYAVDEEGERMGSRRASLGADRRGKVWKTSQGFHHNRARMFPAWNMKPLHMHFSQEHE
jgi:hypothetical protein